MTLCHEHNLTRDQSEPRRFGIRVSLPARDTFSRLLGAGWEEHHWYATEAERDAALADMASEHLYSRRGDRPHVIYSPVEAPEESDSG